MQKTDHNRRKSCKKFNCRFYYFPYPGFANIEVYIAARIESGAANNNAIIVTLSVPRNNGQIPYLGLSETGIHDFERRVEDGLSFGVFTILSYQPGYQR